MLDRLNSLSAARAGLLLLMPWPPQPVPFSPATCCSHVLLVCAALQVITRGASTRVAEYAFQYAQDNKRQTVTALHKANIMKKADGLFIECCREVAGR